MAFLKRLFQGGAKSKKKEYPNVTHGSDPLENWTKVGELGDGAFGTVFKAEHRDSGKMAALKQVPIREETEMDDFMVEIDILTECKHPNIVGLYEAFYFDSSLWIFIEFCSGGAVDDIIVELDHGLSEPQIRCIAKQMFQALEFLHNQGYIHRDVKAGNILLCGDGSIRMADFGVSAKKDRRKHDTFIGTPYWMAPEVIVCETDKDVPYDYRADVWSAGITLIELADMNPPLHEMSPMRVVLKIVKSPPPSLSDPSQWSSDFKSFLTKCLVKDFNSRPTAADLQPHPFIATVTDNKPLRALYLERRAEVQEIVEDLAEDADLTQDSRHFEETFSQSPSVSSSQLEVGSPTSEEAPVIGGATPTTEEGGVATASPTDVGPEAVFLPTPSEGGVVSTAEARPSEGSSSTSSSQSGTPIREHRKSEEDTHEYKYATLSRVRKFRVDGQEIRSTTTKIVDVKSNRTLRDNKKFQQLRKQDFRDLKQLQREEMKEATVFYDRIKVDREAQEKKFESENGELEKRYGIDVEVMLKKQKKDVERLENSHIQQFRSRSKLLKASQTKELKRFKENLREQEKMSLKRTELSSSKSERKQALTQARSDLQLQRQDKERDFMVRQAQEYESELKRILDGQKEERKNTEMRFLDAKQDLARSHTSLVWEMEQRQKQDRHQLTKQQVREAFHMQRHQMHVRHQREVELQARRDQFRLEELRQTQLLEKRQLPKRLKADHKQQVADLRKAIRSKKTDNDKEKFRKLDEQYVKRSQLESELMNERHDKDLETLKAELDTNMRELLEIQNEKKMTLTQQESKKTKKSDEDHTLELREWRGELGKRKQGLEEKFASERHEHEQFFDAERPLPKELRMSLSLSSTSTPDRTSRADRISKTQSLVGVGGSPASSLSVPLSLGAEPRPNSSYLEPLDEVVLGQPPLAELYNGSSNNSSSGGGDNS